MYVWWRISDVWFGITDVWYGMSDVWYCISDVWCGITDMWYGMSDVWYSMSCYFKFENVIKFILRLSILSTVCKKIEWMHKNEIRVDPKLIPEAFPR